MHLEVNIKNEDELKTNHGENWKKHVEEELRNLTITLPDGPVIEILGWKWERHDE